MRFLQGLLVLLWQRPYSFCSGVAKGLHLGCFVLWNIIFK